MKKILPITLAMTFAIPIFAPTDFQSTVFAKSKIESKIKSQLQSSIPSSTPKSVEKKLDLGVVTIYDFGDIKLHAYNTNDPLADEFYLLESNQGMVLLESGAMKSNVAEFNEYIKSLNKPLAGMILSYHPNGFSAYGSSTIYATKGALDSWQEGGGVYGLTQNFIQGFGADKVAEDLPSDAKIVEVGGSISIAGIEFKILATPDPEGNFSVEIPQINSIYRHMMGANVHNILPSIEYIDAEIDAMKDYQSKKYLLILTSHHTPENQKDVATKLSYLKTIKKLAQKSKSKDQFIAAVKKAFPNYEGENYLEMTAGALFQ